MNQEQIIYRKINLIFAGILMGIFIYSGFFAYTGVPHIIPSFHNLLNGGPSISTGLSRSFSAMMKFDFFGARQYNFYGPSLFVFFLVQLVMRLFFTYSSISKHYSTREIVVVDVIVSVGMFVVFFHPFIRSF